MNQQFYKNMALWVAILVMILLLVTMLKQEQSPPPDIAYSTFVEDVEHGRVERVTIEEGGGISGALSSGEKFTTYAPAITEQLPPLLQLAKIRSHCWGRHGRGGAQGPRKKHIDER